LSTEHEARHLYEKVYCARGDPNEKALLVIR
jgi:hypothetical protein